MKILRQLSLFALVAVAIVASARWGSAQPSPPTDAIRGKKTEVFERSEFKPSKSGPGSWLWRQFVAFMEWLGGLYTHNPFLFWVFLAGCVLILLVVVIFIIYYLRTIFTVGGRKRSTAQAETEHRIRLSVAYREESDRRAAEGDYTEAVRYLFLSLVYRLDERGRVSFHKEYTNREYLELVGERLHVRAALRVLVDTLDDHWYAQRPCGRAQYEECLAVYDRLIRA